MSMCQNLEMISVNLSQPALFAEGSLLNARGDSRFAASIVAMRYTLIILAILLFGQAGYTQNEPSMPSTTYLDLSLMDRSVNPADDFFRYVNGKWLDETTIPDDRERWGSFDELRKNTDANTLKVLEAAIASGAYPRDTDQGKAALFFQTGMAVEQIDADGLRPIQDILARVDQIRNRDDLTGILIQLKWAGPDHSWISVSVPT